MKKDQIPVKQIVRQYLGRHGYDGLYSDLLECGCSLDDLMPCSGDTFRPHGCQPGYKVADPSDEFEFLIVTKEEKERQLEKKTPGEWLKDPQFHGLKIISPGGWDGKNLAVDWAKPLTLAEMWDKTNISTVQFTKIPEELKDEMEV